MNPIMFTYKLNDLIVTETVLLVNIQTFLLDFHYEILPNINELPNLSHINHIKNVFLGKYF